MGERMTVEVAAAISCLTAALAIATFFIGRQTAAKNDGKEAGALSKDVEYIKNSVNRIETRLSDDVKRLEGRIDEQGKQIATVSGEAARAHESAKSAHHRIDEHLEREHDMTVVNRQAGNG